MPFERTAVITRTNHIIGSRVPIAKWWSAGAGAWGCYLSHLEIMARALSDGVHSLLILEHDAIPSVLIKPVTKTMEKYWPAGLDCQIYLGGQHRKPSGRPNLVYGPWRTGRQVHRTHAVGYQGGALAAAYAWLQRPESFGHGCHIDHALDAAHQKKQWRVYTPIVWAYGQAAGESSISGKLEPERFWQEKAPGWEPTIYCGPASRPPPWFHSHCYAGGALIRDTVEDQSLYSGGTAAIPTIVETAVSMQKLPFVAEEFAPPDAQPLPATATLARAARRQMLLSLLSCRFEH